MLTVLHFYTLYTSTLCQALSLKRWLIIIDEGIIIIRRLFFFLSVSWWLCVRSVYCALVINFI